MALRTVLSQGGYSVGNGVFEANVILANGDITTSNITSTVAFIGSLTGNASGSAATVTTAAQPNITSTGSLTGLTVSNATGIVNFTTSANVTLGAVGNLHISGGTNGYVLSTDGSGALSWISAAVASGSNIVLDTFSGNGVQTVFTLTNAPTSENYTLININGVSQLHSAYTVANANVTLSTAPANGASIEVMTFNLGGGGSSGNTSNISNGTSNVSIATSGGNVTTSVAGNANVIIVTGTGVNVAGTLNATGNLTAGNVSATTFTGALTGAATTAATVTTAAQPNITSVGTLTSLAVTGNITSGNANLGNLVTANFFTGNGYLLTGVGNATAIVNGNSNVNIPSANGNVNISAAGNANVIVVTGTGVNVAGTLNTTGNTTFAGANVTLGAVANLHISGGANGYVLSTDGSGSLSWISAAVAASGSNIVVDTFSGNGVQTVFTLTNAPTSENYTLININGVSQLHSAYTVANANVTLSTAPVNGAAIEVMTFNLGSGSSGATYVEVTNNTSANVNTKYIVNTDSANLTITLPSSPALGDEVGIIDGTGNASVHAITIGRNGGNIQGAASNMTVTTDRSAFTLVYYNVTQGWILTNV